MTIAGNVISRDHETLGLSDPQRKHMMLVMHATRSCILKRQYKFFGEAQISLCAKHNSFPRTILTPEPSQPVPYLGNEMFLDTTYIKVPITILLNHSYNRASSISTELLFMFLNQGTILMVLDLIAGSRYRN